MTALALRHDPISAADAGFSRQVEEIREFLVPIRSKLAPDARLVFVYMEGDDDPMVASLDEFTIGQNIEVAQESLDKVPESTRDGVMTGALKSSLRAGPNRSPQTVVQLICCALRMELPEDEFAAIRYVVLGVLDDGGLAMAHGSNTDAFASTVARFTRERHAFSWHLRNLDHAETRQ